MEEVEVIGAIQYGEEVHPAAPPRQSPTVLAAGSTR
jgi:hypothetical protein